MQPGRVAVAAALAAVLLASLLALVAVGIQEPPPCGPGGTSSSVDVRALSYPSSIGATLPADVYIPQGAGAGSSSPRPIVVMVHGGGWFQGDRHEDDGVARQAAEHGYIAVTFEYDLAAPRYPREINDVRAAISWAREQAPSWGGDPAKIATWGTSAGANLAIAAAAAGDHSGLQAAVGWSGPYDLAALPAHTAAVAATDYQRLAATADPFLYLDCLAALCPDRYTAASPALTVTSSAPPMYLANAATELVPLAQQEQMARTLTRLGVAHKTVVVPGTGHAIAYADQQTTPTLAWLDTTLGFTPPPPPAGVAQLASNPAAATVGLSSAQQAIAATIVAAGKGMGASEQDIVIALAVAQQESGLRNLANDGSDPRLEPDQKDVSRSVQLPHDGVGHDHGSVGAFQQQYKIWGSLEELMNPSIAAQKFFAKLLMVPGRESMSVTVAAQTVQQSATPAAYADDESTARGLYSQFKDTPAIAPSVKVGDPTGGAATPTTGCPGGSPAGGGPGPIGVVANGVTVTLPPQAGIAGTLTFPDQRSATAAAAALSYLGTPYSWGGGGPGGPSLGIHDGGVADSFGDYAKVGFDCSGLTEYAYAQAGIPISGTTGSQWESGGAGPHYAYNDALPGDLIFYGTPTHHVALYLGKVGDRQLMVEAPQSGDVVKVSTVYTSDLVGVTRPTAKAGGKQ